MGTWREQIHTHLGRGDTTLFCPHNLHPMGSVGRSTTRHNNGKNCKRSHPHQTHAVTAIAPSSSSSHHKLVDCGY